MSNEPFTSMADEELEDIGMYRCACGLAVYPTGDSSWRHCDEDRAARGESSLQSEPETAKVVDYFERIATRLAGKEPMVPGALGEKARGRQFAELIGVKTPTIHYRGPLSGLPAQLPAEFVLKPEFASTSIGVRLLRSAEGGDFHDIVTDEPVTRAEVVERLAEVAQRFKGDKWEEATFVVEELLRGRDGSVPPPDIRCYTFQGEVGMILMEHHISGPAHAMYFDGNFEPFADLEDRYGVADGAHDREVIVPAVRPDNADEVLNVARRVSTAVPSAFCRVDLYDTPKGVYLGEITFYPGTFYYRDRKIMHQLEANRLGRLWEQATERLKGSGR